MHETTRWEGKLKRWFTKFKQYKVGYKNGFYQLNCLVNSPYTIIESLAKMPFTKVNREKQLLSIRTFFSNSTIYYREVQTGLWVLVYDNYYKKNLMITNIFDQTLPIEYNYIHFLNSSSEEINKPFLLVNGVALYDQSWSMAKIGEPRTSIHYQGTTERSILVFFTEEWLIKNKLLQNSLELFFSSKSRHFVLHNDAKEKKDFYMGFLAQLEQFDTNDETKLRDQIRLFIQFFTLKLDALKLNEAHFNLSENDWLKIVRVEHILNEKIMSGFPSIESVGKSLTISPTKLKAIFKQVHQKTLYTYFQHKQMDVAHQLLGRNEYPIKDIANMLGYTNASKFSAAFKKRYGVLPSDVTNKVQQAL